MLDQLHSAKVIRTTRSNLRWAVRTWRGTKEAQVLGFLNSVSRKVFEYSGIDKSIILEGAPELPMGGIERTVKIDAFIGPCRNRQPSTKEGPHIDQLHVVIELKQASDSAAKNSLVKYVDQIFIGQPNRILVHGMTIAGSKIRFYVFDRGSVYQSKAYDCVDGPKILIRALIGYQQMSDREMGFDPTVKKLSDGKFEIEVDDHLYKVKTPFRRNPGIFTRATTVCHFMRKNRREMASSRITGRKSSGATMKDGFMSILTIALTICLS